MKQNKYLYLSISLLFFLLSVSIMCILPGDLSRYGDNEKDNSGIIFDNTKNHKIEIQINEDILQLILDEHCEDNLLRDYRLADSFIFDGNKIEFVGIKARGHSSKCNEKRQFKLSFNCIDPYIRTTYDRHDFKQVENRDFFSLDKLNLRANHGDPTIIREMMSFKIFRDNGIPAPRVSTSEVYINGEYWGEYTVVEQHDKTFLKQWYDNYNGNLYKINGPGVTFGPDTYSSDAYQLITNTDKNDTSDIQKFLIDLDNVSTQEDLEKIINVKNLLTYYAVTVMIGHWDSFAGICNNDYIYHNPKDNKWHISPWDCDNTFGSDFTGNTITSDIYAMHRQTGGGWLQDDIYHNLTQKAMEIPVVKSQYQQILCEIINKYDPDMNNDFMDEAYRIKNIIKKFVKKDPHFSTYDYDNFIKGFDTKPDYCLDFNQYPFCTQYLDGIGLKTYLIERIDHIRTLPAICGNPDIILSEWYNKIEGVAESSFPAGAEATGKYLASPNDIDSSTSTVCVETTLSTSWTQYSPPNILWSHGPDIPANDGTSDLGSFDASLYNHLIFYARVPYRGYDCDNIVIFIKDINDTISYSWTQDIGNVNCGILRDSWSRVAVDLYSPNWRDASGDLTTVDWGNIKAIMPASWGDTLWVDDMYFSDTKDSPIPTS